VTVVDVGDRVFAVRDADKTEVRLYGRGVYAGDKPRPGSSQPTDDDLARLVPVIEHADANPMDVTGWYDRMVETGEMTRQDADDALAAGQASAQAERAKPMVERARALWDRLALNPCIELDNGGTVWGFQCWWGAEDQFDRWAGGRQIVEVGPPGT
jgi:hypothetical protein